MIGRIASQRDEVFSEQLTGIEEEINKLRVSFLMTRFIKLNFRCTGD